MDTDSQIDSMLLQAAYGAMGLQRPDGSMPAGRNGPHNHRMTPARNTSHWLITFSYAYSLCRDECFMGAAERCIGFITGSAIFPHKRTFYHRAEPGKDQTNGLIGPAWTLEALILSGLLLEREDCITLAAHVFEHHPFDQELGLWENSDLVGNPTQINSTINQQIWFAAIGAELACIGKCSSTHVEQFLDRLDLYFSARKNGLIQLGISADLTWVSKTKRLVRRLLSQELRPVKQREFGYQLFTLYGLARIFCAYGDHAFFETCSFRESLKFAFHRDLDRGLESNPYGYPYNVVGFESVYIAEVFSALLEADRKCKAIAWKRFLYQASYFDTETGLSVKGRDLDTLSARLYELVRLQLLIRKGVEAVSPSFGR